MDLDLKELNEWLEGYQNFERNPDENMLNLATMQTLLDFFEHPEKAYKSFHVAGSKGKGTTSATIAAILREAGYTTGVFASPHVLHFVERVGTGEGPFAPEIYDAAFLELKNGIEKIVANGILKKSIITWYELVTVFAMLCFKLAKVDYAIFEVGLGGRLDATNVIVPECAVINMIELEHTQVLGDTIAKIAREKAGIIKENVPVVVIDQDKEALHEFIVAAREKRAPITIVYAKGDYMSRNRALAMSAVETVLPQIDEKLMQHACEKVKLIGRYQKIRNVCEFKDIPYIIVDSAHTVQSTKYVLRRLRHDNVHGALLFGCASDKKVGEMADEIMHSNIFDKVFVTRPGGWKHSDFEKLQKTFSERFDKKALHCDADYEKEILCALEFANKNKIPLVVLGSIYLVGEVLRILELRVV